MVMVNRWSVLFLIVGALIGYVIFGTSVKAQSDPLPFSVGDEVVLGFVNPDSVYNQPEHVVCSVTAIRGTYVACRTPVNPRRPPEMAESWYNLQLVWRIQRSVQ
jgi:hypothetical protein